MVMLLLEEINLINRFPFWFLCGPVIQPGRMLGWQSRCLGFKRVFSLGKKNLVKRKNIESPDRSKLFITKENFDKKKKSQIPVITHS